MSKIMQFFSYLNGYGVLLYILLIYEIASSNPTNQAHVIVLVLNGIYLPDCAKESFSFEAIARALPLQHPSLCYFTLADFYLHTVKEGGKSTKA
jgi:hypothetical protein